MNYSLNSSSHPSELRVKYLDSLIEPQEYYVESLVSEGVTLTYGDIAYAVVTDDVLVEIYTVPEYSYKLIELFRLVVEQCEIKTVLCKSYDTQLLYAALSRDAKVTTEGYLFRRIVDVTHERAVDGVFFRTANNSDVEAVMKINDGFFQSIDEIHDYRNCDGLFVLEARQGIVGCGIGKAVITERVDVDIGMLVARAHRNRGFGCHIVRCLKDHFLREGLRPICGCAASNIASKRALEKAGFVSDHRLISISY